MGDPVSRREKEPFKFHEGWIDRKIEGKSKWEELWLVLKGHDIFIFTHSNIHNEDTHIGRLPINSETRFDKKSLDERKGYVFELYTIASKGRSLRNKFKTDKKSDMEMWRGYIMGLAKGALPSDLDLPLNMIEDMDILLQQHTGVYPANNRNSVFPRTSIESFDSGRESITSPTRSMRSVTGNSSSGSEGTNATFISNRSGGSGGRVRRHKFSNNPHGDDTIPSWFFPNCSREFAHSIFKTKGCRYGDTLMRESSNNAANGDYVVTHCSEIQLNGEPKCDHYKVVRTAMGYKLYVENPHDEVRNLTDVMNLFVEINGQSRTNPMITNDLDTLGLNLPDHGYSSYVPQEPTQQQRVKIPDFGSEPVPDYLEPPKQRPKTFTASMLNKEQQLYDQRMRNEANEDQFRRRESQNKTVNPRNFQSRYSSPLTELQQFSLPRVTPASRQRLPSGQSSYTSPLPNTARSEPSPPAPHIPMNPLPPPHIPKNQIGYENDEYDDTATRLLRPPSFRAPSPPVTVHRDILERRNQTRRMSEPAVPYFPRKDPSRAADSGLSTKVSPANIMSSPPKSILVNEKKKENNQQINTGLSVTGLRKVETNSKRDSDRLGDTTPEIDTKSPGGVLNQVKKFEKSTSTGSMQDKQLTDVQKRTGMSGLPVAQRGGVTNTHINPSACNHDNVYVNTPCPDDGIIYENTDDSEVYDDTNNTDIKKVTFTGSRDQNTSVDTQKKVTGAKADFREELNEKLKARMERTSVSSDQDYENMYEELPTLPEDEDH